MSDFKISDLYNKRIKVPELFPRIKTNDEVTWLVNSKRKTGPKPFIASGRIIKIYTTTFGGRSRKMAAKIEAYEPYTKVFPNRKYTTVTLDNLKLKV